MIKEYKKKFDKADFLFFPLSLFALFFSKLTNVENNWIIISILVLFIAVYLREKVKYLFAVLLFIIAILIITKNTVGYNFFFSVFVLSVGLSAIVEVLEEVVSRVFKNYLL
jgi:hypothetical protein